MQYAIRHTKTDKYYSPDLDGKTLWAEHGRAYTYESYDLAAHYSQSIETDFFEIVEYVPVVVLS